MRAAARQAHSSHKPAPSAEVRAAIVDFLAKARQPVLLEPGDDPFRIQMAPEGPENLQLSDTGGRLTLECWRHDAAPSERALDSPPRTVVRRILAIRNAHRGKLELETERFGGHSGVLSLIDAAPDSGITVRRQGNRLKYREQFRLSLKRQFPDWNIIELSTEQDLEHSLSPAYPRAFLRKGAQRMVAIGASEDCLDPDGVLSFGLIWLDYIRRREHAPPGTVRTLALFLPIGFEANTCHRVRHLNAEKVRCIVFAHGSGITEERVDPAGYTNFETRLAPFLTPVGLRRPEAGQTREAIPWSDNAVEWVHHLSRLDDVDCIALPSGLLSLRVRGVEFAHAINVGGDHNRVSGTTLLYGLRRKRTAVAGNLPEIEALARGLARLRNPEAEDRVNHLYRQQPEAWLESQVRRHVDRIDASVYAPMLYEQAPQLTFGDRTVMDLLGVDRDGRLCVIEIKASQDIHLPLQALDYWMRVKWHLKRGEFSGKGYFPGVALRGGVSGEETPRLLLVAPATEFHPTNETILSYVSSDVSVQCIGVGIEWRRDLRVMFRH